MSIKIYPFVGERRRITIRRTRRRRRLRRRKRRKLRGRKGKKGKRIRIKVTRIGRRRMAMTSRDEGAELLPQMQFMQVFSDAERKREIFSVKL